MDTSNSVIETLSNEEIALVAGGKANQPTKPWYERMFDWFQGLGSAPAAPSGGIVLTGAEIVQMQRECRATGGDFFVTGATAGGGGGYQFVNAEGQASWVNIRCVD